MTRLRASKGGGDDGVTLIEMMVVLSILGGVIAGVTTALMVGFRTMTGNELRLEATAQSKTAVESMTRSLRTAIMPSQLKGTCDDCDNAAFISGDATSVTFYANLDNDSVAVPTGLTATGPSKVVYDLENGVLTETITRPKPHAADDYVYSWCENGATSCSVRTRIVARDVDQAGAALFTYYDRAGATLPVPLQDDDTRLRSVDSIDLLIKVQVEDRVRTATTTTRVTLPNADSMIQPSASPMSQGR